MSSETKGNSVSAELSALKMVAREQREAMVLQRKAIEELERREQEEKEEKKARDRDALGREREMRNKISELREKLRETEQELEEERKARKEAEVALDEMRKARKEAEQRLRSNQEKIADLERQLGVEQLSRDADDGDAQIAAAQTAVCYLLEASLTPPPFSFSPSVTLPCFVLFVFNSFYLCSIVVSHSSQL